MPPAVDQDRPETSSIYPSNALVVVPVFNEAENIVRLIERITALSPIIDVLVVDDNSPDGTADLVRRCPEFEKRAFLLQREHRLGFARACRDGFLWGVDRGYDVCLEMDADFSHDPDDIPRLLDEIAKGADIALGSRYLNGVRVINWPAARLLLSLFAGKYTRFLSGLTLTDPTSGFKAIRRRVITALDWTKFAADGYGFIIELHFQASRMGFQIQEVPVVFTERRNGASKMSFKIMRESALRVACLGAGRLFARRVKPRPVPSLGYT